MDAHLLEAALACVEPRRRLERRLHHRLDLHAHIQGVGGGRVTSWERRQRGQLEPLGAAGLLRSQLTSESARRRAAPPCCACCCAHTWVGPCQRSVPPSVSWQRVTHALAWAGAESSSLPRHARAPPRQASSTRTHLRGVRARRQQGLRRDLKRGPPCEAHEGGRCRRRGSEPAVCCRAPCVPPLRPAAPRAHTAAPTVSAIQSSSWASVMGPGTRGCGHRRGRRAMRASSAGCAPRVQHPLNQSSAAAGCWDLRCLT